jgi:hypothetical protein
VTDNLLVPTAIHPPLRYDTTPQWVVFVSALLLVFVLIEVIGPASESLRRTNAREAVRACPSMGIWRCGDFAVG